MSLLIHFTSIFFPLLRMFGSFSFLLSAICLHQCSQMKSNKTQQRYYRYLNLKSKYPDAAVPPLDETLRKITEPDVELLSRNKSIIEELRRSFELKDNPELKNQQEE